MRRGKILLEFSREKVHCCFSRKTREKVKIRGINDGKREKCSLFYFGKAGLRHTNPDFKIWKLSGRNAVRIVGAENFTNGKNVSVISLRKTGAPESPCGGTFSYLPSFCLSGIKPHTYHPARQREASGGKG
jgi:hypothetical protein